MNKVESVRDIIASRAAKFINDGEIVNLGVGLPTHCLDFVDDGIDYWVHSENGITGMIAIPEGEVGPKDVFDAGSHPTSVRPGGSITNSCTCFGYIRDGRIDKTLLGAYQVDAMGNLANWALPGKLLAGPGGAMDLVCGAKTVVVVSTHTDKDGNPKFVEKTELPLTGYKCVDYFVSELCTIHITEEGPVLEDLAEGVSLEEVLAKTGAKLIIK